MDPNLYIYLMDIAHKQLLEIFNTCMHLSMTERSCRHGVWCRCSCYKLFSKPLNMYHMTLQLFNWENSESAIWHYIWWELLVRRWSLIRSFILIVADLAPMRTMEFRTCSSRQLDSSDWLHSTRSVRRVRNLHLPRSGSHASHFEGCL